MPTVRIVEVLLLSAIDSCRADSAALRRVLLAPRLNQDQLGRNWCITMWKAVKVPSKCEALVLSELELSEKPTQIQLVNVWV